MQKIKQWILNYNFIFAFFALVAIGVSFQKYLPAHTFNGNFTFYNNYILFKSSIHHLLEHKDMYIPYENEGAWDLYKYSPTFAVFMLPYAFLPDLPGLILWNLTNVLLLFFALKSIPGISDKNKKIMLWFILPELMLSTQSSQSNALIAALCVFTFSAFENKKLWQAAVFIALATCIKPYGIVMSALFLFYPNKIRFVLRSIIVGAILIALPLILTSFHNLQFQYSSWFNMLSHDYSDSTGISVMALVNDISGTNIDKIFSIITGTLLTFSVLIFYKRYADFGYRISFVAVLLLWVVIFNHKSESPTFIIPVTGVALWYFSQTYTKVNFILLILVLIFTQLSSSDIFPSYVRHEIFAKIHIKVIPCLIVWSVLIWDFYRKGQQRIA